MSTAMDATASSLEALTTEYGVIAHNLANASTVGYKRQLTTFSRYLNEPAEGTSTAEAGASEATGTIVGETSVDFTQGALVLTGRPLDLALKGKGFFVLETPEGPLYTRAGAFRTDQRGQLVDPAGRGLAGQTGPIVIPGTVSNSQVIVSRDGEVSVVGRDSVPGQTIGKLRLVSFEDESVLTPAGKGCFRAPETAQPRPAEKAAVYQKFQEASNVNVVQALIGLITVTRLYEANIKTIAAQDERMETVLQVASA